MNKTIQKIACAALGLALILALAGCGSAPSVSVQAAETVPEITVSASSTVRLTPDKATISFGVTTREPTAEAAQRRNSEDVNNVIAVLTERGVEEKSIRTTSYYMYPEYDWSDGDQRIIGYVVTTSMSVQDQEIDGLGKLLSACVSAGINDVDSVTFLCSGYDEAYRQALKQAIEDSRAKAEVLAAAAGQKLGDAVSVTEGWQNSSAKYTRAVNASYEMAVDEAMAAPSFQPGETEISASVTVVYRMK